MVSKKQLGEFENISIFSEKYILVERNSLFNLIDNNGEFVSKTWFKSIKKNEGGGADFVEVKNEQPIQLRSVSLIQSYSQVRSVLKDTAILSFLDTRFITPIEHYKAKVYGVAKDITIIAKVKLFNKEFLLGENGKLYENVDGKLKEYVLPQFFITYTDINRLVDVADKFNCIYNSKYKRSNLTDDDTWGNLYESYCPCFIFGFGGTNFIFNTNQASIIHNTHTTPWGGDTIKVRIVKDLLECDGDKFFNRIEEFGYEKCEIFDHPLWQKEYGLNELNLLFDEMKELSNKINFM